MQTTAKKRVNTNEAPRSYTDDEYEDASADGVHHSTQAIELPTIKTNRRMRGVQTYLDHACLQ